MKAQSVHDDGEQGVLKVPRSGGGIEGCQRHESDHPRIDGDPDQEHDREPPGPQEGPQPHFGSPQRGCHAVTCCW